MLNEKRIPEIQCPHCGKKMNTAGAFDQEIPESIVGAFMMCSYCVTISRIDPDLRARIVTADEMAELLAVPGASEQLASFRSFSLFLKAMRLAANAPNN
jgi:hypothetical protein